MSTRTRDEWIEIFWAAGRAAQPILSAEEGLLDDPLEREGVIVQLDDRYLDVLGQDCVETPAACVTGIYSIAIVVQAPVRSVTTRASTKPAALTTRDT